MKVSWWKKVSLRDSKALSQQAGMQVFSSQHPRTRNTPPALGVSSIESFSPQNMFMPVVSSSETQQA